MPKRSDPAAVAKSEQAKQRQAKAVRMRTEGYTWQQIADELGWSNPGNAHRAVASYFANYPVPDADELRQQENEKLDDLERAVRAVLQREHVVIQHGKVVGRFMGWMTDDDGQVITGNDGKPVAKLEEIVDDEPILKAVAQLLRIAERRAKLNGIDRPIVVRIEDEGALDSEIEELFGALKTNEVTTPPGHPGLCRGHPARGDRLLVRRGSPVCRDVLHQQRYAELRREAWEAQEEVGRLAPAQRTGPGRRGLGRRSRERGEHPGQRRAPRHCGTGGLVFTCGQCRALRPLPPTSLLRAVPRSASLPS